MLDPRTTQLTDHLHRGGQWVHFQDSGGDSGYRTSHWVPVGQPFVPPTSWLQKRNILFTVSPGDKNRGPRSATHNDDIVAINTFYAEYDGKDFITEAEWLPNYVEPDLTGLTKARVRGALQKAQTQAIDATYKQDPEKYKARAWAHVCTVEPRPSVVWDSGGGYQTLWLLRDTVPVNADNRATIAHYQREWVHKVGGDPSAIDVRRILRFPGSKNLKPKYAPNYPTVSYQWFEIERQYDFATLIAALPEPKIRTKAPRRRVHVPKGVAVELGTFGDVPKLPIKHYAIAAYNEATNLHDLLLEIGYTDHRDGRMSRPGGDTGGVELLPDNTARIYSAADPLFCDGEHRITPAHVYCVYAHNGDVDALFAELQERFPDPGAEYDEYTDWLLSASGTAALKQDFAQVEGPRSVMMALLRACRKSGRYSTQIGKRQLGEMAGMSHQGANDIRQRLADAGWLTLTSEGKGKKTTTALRPYRELATYDGTLGEKVARFDQGRQYYRANRPDDPWIRNHHTYKKRRVEKGLPEGTPPMGPTALLLVTHLRAYGEMTRARLQQSTGVGQGAATVNLRRLLDYGQIKVVGTGARGAKIYAVAEYAEDALEILRPGMQTHEVGLDRKLNNLELVLGHLDQQYPDRRNMPDEVRKKKAWLEGRYEKLARQHSQTDAYLKRREAQTGIKATQALAPSIKRHRRYRQSTRFDRREEFAMHRALHEAYEDLAPLPHKERVRMLLMAEYTRAEIAAALHAAARAKRGDYQFVGVGDPQPQAAAA